MKKTVLNIILVLLAGTSSLAQTKETRTVDPFTRISYRVPGTLYITQGSPQKIEMEGTKDALQDAETTVQGGKLIIGRDRWTDWGWRDKDKVIIYITVKDIEALSVAGSGNVVGKNKFTTGDLDLSVSGSGSMIIEFEAKGNAEADVSGSGDMDIKGSCNNFDSDVSGSGRVRATMTVQGMADLGISGSGRIEGSGSAKDLKVRVSGSGRVNAGELMVNKCDIHISGSGDVDVSVKDELEANVSGSGSITYHGDPQRINSHSSGSGNIRKR